MTTPIDHESPEPFAPEAFAGQAPAVERLRLQVARISPHFRNVLLTGERGTGKRTVARQLHRLSPGGGRPFVEISVAEFAAGRAQAGDCGTLFLPDLEALPDAVQARLLAQLKSLDREVRVVLASRSDLRGLVAAGRMSHDLYQYAATLEIRMAPLRERLDDLDGLAAAMLLRIGSLASFGEAALDRLRSHPWPGNLAELWNLCRQMAPLDRSIEVSDLPTFNGSVAGSTEGVKLQAVLQRHVLDVLQQCAGNKLRAAEMLGISRSTLYRMLDSASA